jgi:predicted short-subunit dehydrogenase-like oxidoreductase (DUF2520 family)
MHHHERVDDSLSSSIAIIGAGRVGSALGRVLKQRGAPVCALASRDPEKTRAAAQFIGTEAVALESVPRLARRVLITVSDAAISDVAAKLADAGFSHGVALHTAGSRGPEVLESLRAAGVSVGVMHPLQTFPTPERGVHALPGSYFAITGDEQARAWALEIIRLLDGTPLAIPSQQWAMYHAAAVMASNYQVTLIDAALEILEHAGVPPQQGLAALAPIARATLENVLHLGPQDALTGPISRGDIETVVRNQAALRAVSPATQELYRAAAKRTIPIAERRGLDHHLIEQLEKTI